MKSPSNRPTFFVVSATTIIGALSSTIAGSAVAIVIGALAGLIWGLVVGRIVYWLGRHGGWGEMLAVRSVQLGVLIATTLFGGSLFAMMQYAFVLSTPEAVLALMRRPLGGGFTFFVVFNSDGMACIPRCLVSELAPFGAANPAHRRLRSVLSVSRLDVSLLCSSSLRIHGRTCWATEC